jgi:hypothetical protein
MNLRLSPVPSRISMQAVVLQPLGEFVSKRNDRPTFSTVKIKSEDAEILKQLWP